MKNKVLFGCVLLLGIILPISKSNAQTPIKTTKALYQTFQHPDMRYHPFVRWWWNGDKVDSAELVRELRMLKDVGIGGVEINPIEFPAYADAMGKPSLIWLSDEWIDMLRVVFNEARKLDMTCDLLVGSGWPFGGQFLPDSSRSSILMNYTKVMDGPADMEISEQALFAEADPHISSPYLGRTYSLQSLQLIPTPCDNLANVMNVMFTGKDGIYRFHVPDGKFTLSALVRINGFMEVMNGAPGACGPVVDHYSREAVQQYFDRMSSTIEKKLGNALYRYLRAMFIDSMELEGANWDDRFAADFQRRYHYDVTPYLPFFLYKTQGMGDPVSLNPPVEVKDSQKDTIERVRYDFESLKADKMLSLYHDYTDWCHSIGVKSRAQAYGRGLFPLETSMQIDIPECESWTMTWTRHKLGEEMSETDYRKGRAYTMVNKYVSSAAHLSEKQLVSCEEMTNTYTVFNMTLEQLKIGGDQSAISGVTHSIFHGFNYSPKEAAFPGWIQYGAYYSERNNWWKFFYLYNAYKARLSSVLQNVTYKADIAILNPDGDMWSTMGMQNEPFPSRTNVPYKTFIWESISKCGGNSDYVTEKIINQCNIENGKLSYNKNCNYTLLILIGVERLKPETACKLVKFAQNGGRILCIDTIPHKSLGMFVPSDHFDFDLNTLNYRKSWNNIQADSVVQACMEQLRQMDKRHFLYVHPPKDNFLSWYDSLMKKYQLPHLLNVENPNAYVMQNHYVTEDGNDVFFFANAHRYLCHQTEVRFPPVMSKHKTLWVWDLQTGKRYPASLDSGYIYHLDLGPAQSLMLVWDDIAATKSKRVDMHVQIGDNQEIDYSTDWQVELHHSLLDTVIRFTMDTLRDLDSIEEYRNFTGTAIYRKNIIINTLYENVRYYLDLGRVEGVSELVVNGKCCDTMWYGLRRYDITDLVKLGENRIEVRVTTTMGNYLKTLKDLKSVQRWVNGRGREQGDQPMGLIGKCKLIEGLKD